MTGNVRCDKSAQDGRLGTCRIHLTNPSFLERGRAKRLCVSITADTVLSSIGELFKARNAGASTLSESPPCHFQGRRTYVTATFIIDYVRYNVLTSLDVTVPEAHRQNYRSLKPTTVFSSFSYVLEFLSFAFKASHIIFVFVR